MCLNNWPLKVLCVPALTALSQTLTQHRTLIKTRSTLSRWSLTGFELESDQDDVSFAYSSSLYWAMVTMATVGYGDLKPITTKERVVAVFVTVIGASMFGYVIGNVFMLLENFNVRDKSGASHSLRVQFGKRRRRRDSGAAAASLAVSVAYLHSTHRSR